MTDPRHRPTCEPAAPRRDPSNRAGGGTTMKAFDIPWALFSACLGSAGLFVVYAGCATENAGFVLLGVLLTAESYKAFSLLLSCEPSE